MAQILANPFCGVGLDHPELQDVPWPSVDSAAPRALLARCPRAAVTPLTPSAGLARALGVATVTVKDERTRMGLGSFKALGAAYVIACDAAAGTAQGRTYVTASAGNHGLSVAAGAAVFGAVADIFLADTVPESFANRLRDAGAHVHRAGADYEASMAAATAHADAHGAALLSDSSWAGYTARPHRLMEGYLALMAEVFEQIAAPPTHLFLQAGVGGLAGAAAAAARQRWGDVTQVIVVEPEAAPCLFASIKAGAPVTAPGPTSAMGRLDCKVASLIALKGLARDADAFMAISEAEGDSGAAVAAAHGFASTPSGAAGLSGAMTGAVAMGPDARVLVILSETGDA
ncbi:MAG: pyridoxal-phosphate dependent enzyme [Pseudomonadota bacterium]